MADRKYPLEILIGALDKATIPLQNINKQIDSMTKPVARLQKSFQGLSKAAGVGKIGRSMTEVQRAAGGLGDSLMRVGRFAIGLAATAGTVGYFFQKFISGAAASADAVAKLSQKTGISTESIQTLGYVSELAGVSQEGFQSAIGKFTKSMGELRANSGPLFSILSRIDPGFTRLLRSTKGTDDAFRLFIDRLRGVKNESARLALTTAAFGKSAGNMALLANLSAKEFAALEDRMRAIGIVSAEDAKNAEEFQDAWLEVGIALKNVQNVLAAKFYPILTKVAHTFTQWLIDNRPRLEIFANQLADKLPAALALATSAFETMIKWSDKLLVVVQYLSENTWILKTALAGLAVYILGPVVLAIASLGKALIGLGVTMLTTPLGLFLVGLAGISYAVLQIVLNWKMLRATVSDAIDEMVNKIQKFLEAVVQIESSIPIIGKFFSNGGSDTGSKIVSRANVPDTPKSNRSESNVTVSFENMPKGAQVSQPKNQSPVTLDVGYQFGLSGAIP